MANQSTNVLRWIYFDDIPTTTKKITKTDLPCLLINTPLQAPMSGLETRTVQVHSRKSSSRSKKYY